jgi:hypothetical protein
MAVWSVVGVSKLEGHGRLDAEYYQGVFFQNRKALEQLGRKTLAEIATVITNGGTPYHEDLTQGEIRFLTAEHVSDLHVDYSSSKFIRRMFHEGSLRRAALCENDLLVTIKGKIGNPAVVFDLDMPSNINQDVARIVLDETANPFYVAAFMASRFGRLQSQQLATNQINPFLGLGNLRQIEIPEAPKELESEVESLVRRGQAEYRVSESSYLQAERMVLGELGWDTLDVSQPKWWTVGLSRAREMQRLDADHFQPKYDELLAHLERTGKAKPLGGIATYIKRGVQPRYVEGGEVLAINSRYVGKQLINTEQAERTDAAFWDDNPRGRAYKHDVIMNSTGWGTIGRTNCVLHDEKTVVDNHVTIIRVKEGMSDPVYLAVYLNSAPGLMQTEKWLSGSSGQIELYPGDIERFVVYLPSEEVQARVADLVRRSYQAREKAKALLEEAKRKVEELIEGAAAGQG